ncbi:11195_t:CDS:2 [Diversispora eburnea]|uniref:11195_t:CDS:1 n=1 Tax=Diversispora eburnea TaxID=1213867 RepID=A0A9N9ASR0_9GLOM|nr:11195_t:CDS:2 [Diversispora eburnea]
MTRATKSIMDFLKFESLLVESAKSIQDFIWSGGDEIESFKKMTTRMILTPTKDTEETENKKKETSCFIIKMWLFYNGHPFQYKHLPEREAQKKEILKLEINSLKRFSNLQSERR